MIGRAELAAIEGAVKCFPLKIWLNVMCGGQLLDSGEWRRVIVGVAREYVATEAEGPRLKTQSLCAGYSDG